MSHDITPPTDGMMSHPELSWHKHEFRVLTFYLSTPGLCGFNQRVYSESVLTLPRDKVTTQRLWFVATEQSKVAADRIRRQTAHLPPLPTGLVVIHG